MLSASCLKDSLSYIATSCLKQSVLVHTYKPSTWGAVAGLLRQGCCKQKTSESTQGILVQAQSKTAPQTDRQIIALRESI